MDSNNEEDPSNSSSEAERSEISSSSESEFESGDFGTYSKDAYYSHHEDPYRLRNILPVQIDEIEKEITLFHKMNHPNICRCYTSWEDVSCDNEHYIIQMELCDRDLWRVIGQNYLYENRFLLRSYARQILEGLNYIHETINISHGDLKPENVFIKGDQIKIGDFGYAVDLTQLLDESDSEIDLEHCEIPSEASAYTAYEGMGKSTKSDMYSFGVILLEMCNPSFENTRRALDEFRENIDNPNIPTEMHDDYINLYLPFIEQLIGRFPNDRPSAKNLLDKIPEIEIAETFDEPKDLSSASSTHSDDCSDCDNDDSPMDDPMLSEILSSTGFNKNLRIIQHLTTGNYGAIFKAKNCNEDEESAIKIMKVNIG